MAVERLLPDSDDHMELLFHWHRYLAVTELCRERTVLDVACGDGYGSHLLARSALRVVGVDINPHCIQEAERKYFADNLQFVGASAEKLPFPSNSFDVVVSFETIEHLDREMQHRFITEVLRVLKPSGIFIVSTPDRLRTEKFPTKNPYHIYELTFDEFNALLNRYFLFNNIFYQEVNFFTYIWNSSPHVHPKINNFAIRTFRDGSEPTDEDLTTHLYMIAICSNHGDTRKYSINSVCQDITRRPANDVWSEVSSLRRDNEQLRESLGNLEERLEIAKKERDEVCQANIALNDSLNQLSSRVVQLECELNYWRDEAHALRQQCRIVSLTLRRLQEELDKLQWIVNSNAWNLIQRYYTAMDNPRLRPILKIARFVLLKTLLRSDKA
ncbi:MAG: methyltransferase domain-containing protein [Alicyclobacillus sp.]|nr:methyltransferase domain-containing protein [Alicyclobacillus sp.]